MTPSSCSCCRAAAATDLDPHVGWVCLSCAHALEHVGLALVRHAPWGLCHPPRTASHFPRSLGQINTEGPKS